MEMIGLTHARNRPVGEFSKGMARRIGLAQALLNDPDLVILDEPTAGLDPQGTRQVKDLILALAARGKTVLLSSTSWPTSKMSASRWPSCSTGASWPTVRWIPC